MDSGAITTDASSASSCHLSGDWTFGYAGGLVGESTTYTLKASGVLTITRSRSGMPATTCTSRLPECGSEAIDVADIVRDLSDPEVQAVLASQEPPFFGIRSGDVASYDVFDDRGRGFSYGSNQELCTSDHVPKCSAAPAGVVRLVDDLMELAALGRC